MLTHSSLIYLLKSINICTNLLYNNVDVIEGINKSEFENLLSLATQESYFIFNDILYKQKDGVAFKDILYKQKDGVTFNDILYKQKDGVAMGSLLGPSKANVFLSFYEMKWLEQCPNEFKPVF